MAFDLNQVTLIGNAGGDLIVRTISNGSTMASFTLATKSAWIDKQTTTNAAAINSQLSSGCYYHTYMCKYQYFYKKGCSATNIEGIYCYVLVMAKHSMHILSCILLSSRQANSACQILTTHPESLCKTPPCCKA